MDDVLLFLVLDFVLLVMILALRTILSLPSSDYQLVYSLVPYVPTFIHIPLFGHKLLLDGRSL
jgi:hypothetical protein